VATGPLQGLKVLELAAIGPVPMAATLLADLGAEVLRVDRSEPSGLGLNVPPPLDVHSRSRRSIALDLKRPEAREVLLRLIDRSDVLLEGFRPGVAERLGLDPAALLKRQPRLVVGRMTGWGQSGPLAQAAGHDLNYLALTGALAAIGPRDGPPQPPLNLVADYGGGALYLAFGVMAALWERSHSGRGQVVDAAMVDGVASLMGMFNGLAAAGLWNTRQRQANLLDGGAPWYACHRCACGGWLSVAALEPRFFANFVRVTGLDPAWGARQYERESWPELHATIAACIASRSQADWLLAFDGQEACVAPVLGLHEAPLHPHAQARAAYVQVGGHWQPAPAPRFSRSATAAPQAGPLAGADSAAVLAEAGYSDGEIDALRTGRVFSES
jgi:alpha-methylacyl-CoA racemase